MPRFYFHMVSSGQTIPDLEGTELDTLEDARAEALLDARSLMSDALKEGYDISSRSIHIYDEGNILLLKVPYSTAFVYKG